MNLSSCSIANILLRVTLLSFSTVLHNVYQHFESSFYVCLVAFACALVPVVVVVLIVFSLLWPIDLRVLTVNLI